MNKEINRWLKQQKNFGKKKLNLSIQFGLANGLFLLAQAWLLADILSRTIIEKVALADIWPAIFILLVIFILRIGLNFASEHYAALASAEIKINLRVALLQKLDLLGPAYLQKERTGKITNTIIEGIEALEAYYAKYLPHITFASFIPLAILIIIIPFNYWASLLFLVTMPLIPTFIILVGRFAERLNKKQWQQLARMSAHFLDVIQGMTTLKIFNASKQELYMLTKISDAYRQSTMKVLRVAFLSSLIMEFFATASIAFIAIILGYQIFYSQISFMHAFFILLLAPEFYLPLRQMGLLNHARMEAVAAAEEMVNIFSQKNPPHHESNIDFPYDETIQLEFKELYFSYDSQAVLKNINFTVTKGETVAIVGPSGAGKTTLLQLILGFIQPQKGQILVNNIDLHAIKLENWHQHIAWVSQNAKIFTGSLAENIALGAIKIDQTKLSQAIKHAQLEDVIEGLPGGLFAIIGEGGLGLSGGQIQRIALARAFYKNAPLVLLDEPTASLDFYNEQLIQKAIDILCKDRTVIMIAHRLHTIEHANTIIVLENGEIVEQGSHNNLLENKGLYAALLEQGLEGEHHGNH